jgi:phospholipid/cholesterol/gamma-HCH transport system substrate-binding protein
MSTELKVGAVVLIALIVAAVFVLRMEDRSLFGAADQTYTVRVAFDSIAGLAPDSPVRLAGVRVGRVDRIGLTPAGQAEAILRIDSDVVLRGDATASVASLGLLGEKYLELTAGTPAAPAVGDGGSIQAGPAVSVDQMVAVMNGIAADVQETTEALSNVFGSEAGETRMQAILDNTELLTRDLGDIARANRAAIEASTANIEQLTAAMAESLPRMIDEYRALATNASDLIDGNDANLEGAIEEVRALVLSLDRSAAVLEEIMQKVNSGDGTAAQLINTSDTIEKANAALDTIDDSLAAFDRFFNRVGQTQFSFRLRSEWYAADEATKNYFGIRFGLGAREDRAFILEMVNDNIGLPISSTVITETLNGAGEVIDVNIERMLSRDDSFKFSALGAMRVNDWQLRGGLMESQAGIGIDYFRASDRLRFSVDGWDFGRDPDPHLKFSGSFDVWDRLFLTVGGDDLLSSDFRQFFVGAGFRFR